jgi:hypothetical protein
VAELEAPGKVGRLAHEGAAIQVDAVEERVINGFFTSAQHPNKRRGLVCFTIDSEGFSGIFLMVNLYLGAAWLDGDDDGYLLVVDKAGDGALDEQGETFGVGERFVGLWLSFFYWFGHFDFCWLW